MRRAFLFVLALFVLAFVENVTTTESSPTTLDTTGSTTTETSPTKSTVKTSTTTEGSPTTSSATTEGSSTKSDSTKSSTTATTKSVPVESDKPSEDVSSNNIPSFQYFAVPFIPLNGLVRSSGGQYGVLPPSFGAISNSLSQQTERKKVEEPERKPNIQSVIESPAPATLPQFLQSINSMQELTQMVFREMLNELRGNQTCGGFIELEGTTEINHKISWGLPPADVESCSWVIWAKGGGPITVDFPKESNAAFDDRLSSLWVLNINRSLIEGKTLLKPGDVKTFRTDVVAKGYYPFVVVHMLVKETVPGQRLHLKFNDENEGSTYQLRPNVTYLNGTLTYAWRTVFHPPNRMSSYGQFERFFFMGQTPKGKRVSLEIFHSKMPTADRQTWIQVSWIDLDNFQVHNEKLSGGSVSPLRKNLKPSTTFVVVFCSHNSGDAGSGFSLYYRYY